MSRKLENKNKQMYKMQNTIDMQADTIYKLE